MRKPGEISQPEDEDITADNVRPTLLDPLPNIEQTKVTDPFDLSNLRLSQNFSETAGVKKLLKTVPVRKPNPQDFVRVHSEPAYRENFPVVQLKDDREEFLVPAGLLPELVGEFVSVTLFTAINRQGVLFLWPVRLPDPQGRQMEWWRSMREAAELAMTQWIRTKPNMSLGAYEIFVAESTMSEPEWPTVSYADLIKLAFRDRLIDSLSHPVVKRLRGA
jgi:hypothetical protein